MSAADLESLCGLTDSADANYRRATTHARERGWWRVAAEAHESYGRALDESHLEGATAQLEHAADAWERFGALANVRRIERLLSNGA